MTGSANNRTNIPHCMVQCCLRTLGSHTTAGMTAPECPRYWKIMWRHSIDFTYPSSVQPLTVVVLRASASQLSALLSPFPQYFPAISPFVVCTQVQFVQRSILIYNTAVCEGPPRLPGCTIRECPRDLCILRCSCFDIPDSVHGVRYLQLGSNWHPH